MYEENINKQGQMWPVFTLEKTIKQVNWFQLITTEVSRDWNDLEVNTVVGARWVASLRVSP